MNFLSFKCRIFIWRYSCNELEYSVPKESQVSIFCAHFFNEKGNCSEEKKKILQK